jgi:uncharacterized protein YlzI (FlbEa/FlbD family)
MDWENCTFVYDGNSYIVNARATEMYRNELPILMPNGVYLVVGEWLESVPPQIETLDRARFNSPPLPSECYHAIKLLPINIPPLQ